MVYTAVNNVTPPVTFINPDGKIRVYTKKTRQSNHHPKKIDM